VERIDHAGWRIVQVFRSTQSGEAELISRDRYAAPAE
jgi:hypothetical protein